MSPVKKLLQEIETTNRRYGLIKRNDTLVLGVSGGPDSMALLILLDKLKKKYALTLHVAHLDHGLRGKESIEHRIFTQKVSERLGHPFHWKAVKLQGLVKIYKRSIEETGRMERYRFFEEVARKTGSQKIVTAHTLDDQAETMLLRLLRGSGLKGLVGIHPIRKQCDFEVIRPLLSCQKRDLMSFLKKAKVLFVDDKSNRDPFFTRNRVRHQLLPMLEKSFNPQIKRSLANLQSICAEAQDYLERVSLRAFRQCTAGRPSVNKVSLKISALKRRHPAIAREVLIKAMGLVKGDLKKFAYSHIAMTMDIINSQENNLHCHLPNQITVSKKGEKLSIFRRND